MNALGGFGFGRASLGGRCCPACVGGLLLWIFPLVCSPVWTSDLGSLVCEEGPYGSVVVLGAFLGRQAGAVGKISISVIGRWLKDII